MNSSPPVRRARALGDRPALALGAVAATVTVTIGALFALLLSTGWAPVPAHAATVHTPVVPIMKVENSPADQLLTQVLTTPVAGWSVAGKVVQALTPPEPFSCMKDGTAPALSRTEHVNVAGTGVDVTVTAYAAGLGAPAYQTLHDGAADCGSGRVTITPAPGLGVEGAAATLAHGTGRSTAVVFRRGDVIAYTVGTDAGSVAARAAELDRALEPALHPVCAEEVSATGDSHRNPFSVAGYTAYRVPQTVTIPTVALPAVPTGATYQAIPLTQPLPAVTPVVPAATPTYPVWPLMPTPVTVPVPPQAPAAAATTSADAQVLTDDTTGPGCGWKFTGMTAPRFDTTTAKKTNSATVAAAKKQLTDASKTWQQSVTAYWQAATAYVAAVPAYTQYSAQVTAVNTAWAAIAGQWDAYNVAHSSWQARVTAADDLAAQQKTAQQQYDQAYTACVAASTPSPTPTPGQTTTPTPAPTAPPAATGAGTAPIDPATAAACRTSVPRPAVLDQRAPNPGPEPQKPADQRPVSAQK